MKKSFERILSLVLAVLMLAGMFPAQVTPSFLKAAGDRSTDGTHSDLADLLTSVTINIDGQEVTGSNWYVEKNYNYDITLSFMEEPNTSLQIDTSGPITFHVPDEVKLNAMTRDLVLTYQDGQGHTQIITGNSFSVDPATNLITLNLDQDTRNKIEDSGKTNFTLHIVGSFEKSTNGVEWSGNIKRNVIIDDRHDLSINKEVVSFDQVTNIVTYRITVHSTGNNENVVVTDTVTGTALTLINDITSTGTNATPAISKDGNSFTATYYQ